MYLLDISFQKRKRGTPSVANPESGNPEKVAKVEEKNQIYPQCTIQEPAPPNHPNIMAANQPLLLPQLPNYPIEQKQGYYGWPDRMMLQYDPFLCVPGGSNVMQPYASPYMQNNEMLKQWAAQYYGLPSQDHIMPSFYNPERIHLLSPNIININNLNTMGNAYIINGNPPSNAGQQVGAKMNQPKISDKKLGNETPLFKVQIDQDYYKLIYSKKQ